MKAEDLIELIRTELGDKEEPFLWETKELIHYLNHAVQEACERALLIEDRSTARVCRFKTAPGIDTYELHASLIKIKRITVAGKLLHETSVEEMDAASGNWEQQFGQPHSFIFEGSQGGMKPKVRLIPRPTAEADVQMTVYRGAIAHITERTLCDEPEVPWSMRDALKYWVLRCAYMKVDTDAQNPVKAAEYEGLFTAVFGSKPDANTARKRRDRKPPIVQCAW